MKKLALILLLCFLPALFGCWAVTDRQNIRDNLVSFAAEDKANVEALRQISNILKESWLFYSGCLDAISNQISGNALSLQKELDKLYVNGEWDDRAAGKALVLRALLVIEITTKGIEEVLPGLLKLLAPLL